MTEYYNKKGVFGLKKFSLELTLEEIRKRSLEMRLGILEIATKEKIFRVPLEKIDELALVSEQ